MTLSRSFIRIDVSQGYTSNRSTPNATPNVSPNKVGLLNPSNTPETSPIKGGTGARGNIFRTEHEIIQEAVEDALEQDENGDIKVPVFTLGAEKKRARVDESDNEDELDPMKGQESQESTQTSSQRLMKPLPRKKAPSSGPPPLSSTKLIKTLSEVSLQNDEGSNPFLVSSSDSVISP